MDNDNKVIIQKPEVELFLQDDIYAFNREKPRMYDLEKEFAEVKKNKKHTILWPLIILFVISIILTFGITYYIRYQNRQITVNVDVFEDINLRKLLDMVSKIESQIDETKKTKVKTEERRLLALDGALSEKEAELITIDSLPISSNERNARIEEAEAKYEASVAEITEKYDNEIAMLDITLKDLEDQLNAYDSANIERAQQQQAAIDSQRQLYEIEKQQLTENYEATIKDLQEQLTLLQEKEITMRVEITEEIAAQYQSQYSALEQQFTERLESLDPTVTDSKYVDILERTNITKPLQEDSVTVESINSENESNPIDLETGEKIESTEVTLIENEETLEITEEEVNISIQDRLAAIENVPEELRDSYETLMILSKDYETATELLLSIPQENDIPKYVLAMEVLNSEMNNNLLDLYYELSEELAKNREDYYQEKDVLQEEKTRIQNLLYMEQNKNSELKENNETLNKIYSYFEKMSLEKGDSGYILDVSDKEKILVYISPLYAKEIDYTLGYVFRKSDDLIGTVTLVKDGDFYYGIPATTEVGLAIKPGDKILLDVEK